MIRALYMAASGMSAQQMNLDTVANNLANSATTGFRRRNLQFEDMMYQNLVTPGSAQSSSTVVRGFADRAGNARGLDGSGQHAGRLQPDGKPA